VQYLTILALPEHDLNFFERLVRATPNLNRLSVYFDDLLEIIHIPQHNLCQILQKRIYYLEIHLDYLWSISAIRRDIPKILRTFSNIKSLTILLHSAQRRSLLSVKELLTSLFKHQTNLICIHIDGSLSIGFDQIIKQGGIDLIKTWLIRCGDTRFQYNNYLKNSVHIELNSSSVIIWL
jgi:hypothetical protein